MPNVVETVRDYSGSCPNYFGEDILIVLWMDYIVSFILYCYRPRTTRGTNDLTRSCSFIDIFLANLCLMSRITMIEARPMPQYLHTFLHAIHPTTASTKKSQILEDFAPTASSSDILAPAISLSEADHECHHERE